MDVTQSASFKAFLMFLGSMDDINAKYITILLVLKLV